ncbi:MAG TPA: zinc-ribbon domain-containing protein [Gemmataceae bacterium]|nr:zinc-ribbon domain-containing protein [Gemmataceae bacterium]
MPHQSDLDDEWDDNEVQGFQVPEEEEEETVPCPHCRRQIYEDAERCPNCGHYLSIEDGSFRARPWWFISGFVICVVIVVGWILRG